MKCEKYESDKVAEGLDEECDSEGETQPFYDVTPDAEESSVEDDVCYEWCEDHNEDSDTHVEESEPASDESNVLFPSITTLIEEVRKN